MAKSIDELIREADVIIEKRASKKSEVDTVLPADDDVVKLAALLVEDVMPATSEPKIEETLVEKVAHAIALVETLSSLNQIQKIMQFEKTAKEAGHTDEQIDAFLEKNAALKPVHKYVTLPGMLAGVVGGLGYSKGKKKGYEKALDDVNKAFSAYEEPSAE